MAARLDENEDRYEQLRRRLLDLHAVAVEREAAAPRVVAPAGLDDDPTQTARLDEMLATGGWAAGGGPAGNGAGEAGAGEAGAGEAGAGEAGADGGTLDFALEPDAALVAAVDELTAATDAFLTLGDRLPVLRDVPARAWSVQIVRASAFAVLLGAVLLGLGIWRDILAVWWLPVLLAMLPAAVRMALIGVAPAAGRHRRQRYAAAVAGASALVVAPGAAVFGWPAGLGCAAVFVVAVSVLLELRWGRA